VGAAKIGAQGRYYSSVFKSEAIACTALTSRRVNSKDGLCKHFFRAFDDTLLAFGGTAHMFLKLPNLTFLASTKSTRLMQSSALFAPNMEKRSNCGAI
jgi:hypothetical protein